ncbi:AAA family ATPase, partial [Schaalia hyovaginalis]
EYRLGGLSIADVLDLSAARAAEFFARKESRVAAAAKLAEGIAAVGLGYLGIGQPLSTLSGGERQRLKLAVALGSDAPILVLDEPTTGLHPADVDALVDVFDRIVDEGRSVILVEHDPAVIARADWVIDLGPGAGTQGGRIVFEGRPADLASCSRSLTGHHLALALEGGELHGESLADPGR